MPAVPDRALQREQLSLTTSVLIDKRTPLPWAAPNDSGLSTKLSQELVRGSVQEVLTTEF